MKLVVKDKEMQVATLLCSTGKEPDKVHFRTFLGTNKNDKKKTIDLVLKHFENYFIPNRMLFMGVSVCCIYEIKNYKQQLEP